MESDADAATRITARRRRLVVRGLVLVLALGAILWASRRLWPSALDVKRATIAELIDASRGTGTMLLMLRGTPEYAANRELLSRAAMEVDAEIERASFDARADRRIASLMARGIVVRSEETVQPTPRRARHLDRLIATLDDRDVAVRVSAFEVLCATWRWTAEVPTARWFEVASHLLESADPAQRWSAAFGAFELRDRAEPLVPALLAGGRREQHASLRFMIATALGVTGTRDEGTISLLTAWLDDADAALRSTAATSLGELGAKSAIGRLFVLARDTASTEDVRRAAVRSLAKLVSERADVDAVLEILLEQQPKLKEYNRFGWCESVARAAMACPTAESVRAARERLRTIVQSDESSTADAATSALVRIAAAARTELPSAADVDRLWEVARGFSDDDDDFLLDLQLPAFEALIALAHWPESGVSAATLQQMLERRRQGKEGPVRADIDRLLARLPS